MQEFLKLFSRDSIYGESFLSLLVKYMIGTANFIHHFRIILHDAKALNAKRNHKVKLILEYNGMHPDENLLHEPEFIIRHNLFSMHNKLQISTHYLFLLQKLKDLLLRISNENDLYMLIHQKIINENTLQLFLDRPYAKNIQISIMNGSKELSRGTTVLNLVNKKSQIQLKFRIIKRASSDLSYKYLKSPKEILENIIQDSVQVGLDTKDKSYVYFRLVKYLYKVSEYFPHMMYCLNSLNSDSVLLSSFISSKLSSLLLRQLQCSLSVEGNAPAQ